MFIIKSLLHASGRHGQKSFIIGLLVFSLIYWPQKFIFTGPFLNNFWGFTVSLFVAVLNCYMIYALCAKRLHDMGRSVWAFTAMISLELCVIITTGLAYGMADYFTAFADYDRKEEIPEEVRQEIITNYQASLQPHMTEITILFWVVPVLFCLWLALSKGQASENKYGPVPAI